MKVVLASGSVTRQGLLREAGVVFSVEAANVDESAVMAAMAREKAGARATAAKLAELKAVKVSSGRPGDLIIGADQVLSIDRELFQKPHDAAEAGVQLRALRGRTHMLSSAVAVAQDGAIVWGDVREARLTMRAFSDGFLEKYLVEAGADIQGSVGGVRVEGLGIQLLSRIEGDYFTILGLPLIPLLDFLRSRGILRA